MTANGVDRSQFQNAILVVEDEILIRLDLAQQLRAAGYRILEASTGEEALTILQRVDTVDLVITDVRMPGKTDGLGLAAWLRRNLPRIKIVLVSGHVPASDMFAAAHAVFEKPVIPTFLLQKVRQLLADAPG
jgi:CheY-like chemotaxis protein